jgi:hypothetical protein
LKGLHKEQLTSGTLAFAVGTGTFDADTFEAKCRFTGLDEGRLQSEANISMSIDFRDSLRETGLYSGLRNDYWN